MTLTLFTITNIEHKLTTLALEKTRAAVPCTEIRVISNQPLNLSVPYTSMPLTEKFGMLEYCDFCLKSMYRFIDTEFVLIAHYDGMATNPNYWTDEYFDYDYVGSPSHPMFPPMMSSLQSSGFFEEYKNKDWFTCGGGFTLRSKRLLNILANDPKIQTQNYSPEGTTPFISEDAVITLLNREYLEKEHKIRFAPLHLSLKFCAEVLTGYSHALGFHGWYNAPLFLSEPECLYYFEHLNKQDYNKNTAQMQICKHNTMMRGYLQLREYLISWDKWLIY
jgi:hypothetical protein